MKPSKLSLNELYDQRLKAAVKTAPFVVRITEWKGEPVPVVVIKERRSSDLGDETRHEGVVERGHIKGDALRRLLPILKKIATRVMDNSGIPTEVDRFMSQEGLKLRLTLPLNEEAGAKMALIFKLQERLPDLDRAELIARRVNQFTREEALYWLSRVTDFGPDMNRWAVSGLRLLLGGQAGDPAVQRMLEKMRAA